MAQLVGFFEDNVEYEEGPFVMCEVGGRYRIEVELEGHHCPVLPDHSVLPVLRRLGMSGKTWNRDLAERVCDHLNQMVEEGKIVKPEGKYYWVCKEKI